MNEYARKRHESRKPPVVDPDKPRPSRVTRQRRARLNRDAEYNAFRDLYLEQNPCCVLCDKPATQVHHIVGGVAGRGRSLLNPDTWLGVCGTECHELIEAQSKAVQVSLKQTAVRETIERLRK